MCVCLFYNYSIFYLEIKNKLSIDNSLLYRTSSVLANEWLELLGKVETRNSGEDYKVATTWSNATKGLVEHVQGNLESGSCKNIAIFFFCSYLFHY